MPMPATSLPLRRLGASKLSFGWRGRCRGAASAASRAGRLTGISTGSWADAREIGAAGITAGGTKDATSGATGNATAGTAGGTADGRYTATSSLGCARRAGGVGAAVVADGGRAGGANADGTLAAGVAAEDGGAVGVHHTASSVLSLRAVGSGVGRRTCTGVGVGSGGATTTGSGGAMTTGSGAGVGAAALVRDGDTGRGTAGSGLLGGRGVASIGARCSMERRASRGVSRVAGAAGVAVAAPPMPRARSIS